MGAFEILALQDTALHRLHPLAKMCCTLAFIVGAASCGRYGFSRLAPFIFYPVLAAAFANVPWRAFFPGLLVALPLCLFAGISNVITDRATAFIVCGVPVSFGVLSLLTVLLKLLLCVTAVLLLVATTPLTQLSAQLRRLHIPGVIVTVFEMTFRYIGVLANEAFLMTTAYSLRSGGKKALEMRHMGSFLGQLLLRGFDRAERVYNAMLCRGYGRRALPVNCQRLRVRDCAVTAGICALILMLRFARIY
jgi:cobalt/nickel transport system permease protein